MWDVAVEIDPRTFPEWSLMGVIQPNKCEEPVRASDRYLISNRWSK